MRKEEVYHYYISKFSTDYEFESIGPRGVIKKIVRFTEMQEDIYNLGFGDWDDITGDIDDTIVSDNEDVNKVLLTVAAIVIEFTNIYTNAFVFIKGSTDSRTRLYQMGITKFWTEIQYSFNILGYKNKEWISFEKGINYEAFLGSRKL